MVFIYCKSVGVNFPTRSIANQQPLPTITINRLLTLQRLSENDFRQIAQIDLLDPEYISELLRSHVGISSMISVPDFRDAATIF